MLIDVEDRRLVRFHELRQIQDGGPGGYLLGRCQVMKALQGDTVRTNGCQLALKVPDREIAVPSAAAQT